MSNISTFLVGLCMAIVFFITGVMLFGNLDKTNYIILFIFQWLFIILQIAFYGVKNE